jgi:hypothetical protein
MTPVPFGARFLAEFRALGATVGRWKYATVLILERADRELLARRVVEEERARAADASESAAFSWTF